jgi:carboxypeptidase Q
VKKTHLIAVLLVATTSLLAADSPDLQMQTRIRQEGFRNSKVMEIAQGLMDGIGGRLTGSPNMKKANEWTRDKLTEFGMANAHLEGYEFGRGWSTEYCVVRMLAPDNQQLYGIPKAWSPSTNGVIRGKVVKVKLETKEDLEKNKGKLAGSIVLIADPREMKPLEKAALDRYTDEELEELSVYEIPRDNPRAAEFGRRREFRRQLAQFAMDEKIAAFVDVASGEGGVFRVQSSGSSRADEPQGVPNIGLAPEHYGRIVRLLDKKVDVELELEARNQFHDADKNAYNTIAEIPGSDKKGEVVMLGAHLDSWHTGTGATDNGAGSVVMMEVMRIIKSLGVTPRRTIRIGLWSGEEQGLIGARAYVAQHFAGRGEPKDAEQAKLPIWLRSANEKGALMPKPDHAKVSAYFNMDNGTGKIRGIYAQENAAVAPIFAQWLTPMHDLGATTVTMRNTGSTDHVAFDEVGIPGFQFIQDDVEYSTRTHHTNWDTYERLQREDLMQAAVVIATMVWETANRPEMLPRKPLPTK